MNGFIGLNDVLKNINTVKARKDLILKWYLEHFTQAFSNEPDQDN